MDLDKVYYVYHCNTLYPDGEFFFTEEDALVEADRKNQKSYDKYVARCNESYEKQCADVEKHNEECAALYKVGLGLDRKLKLYPSHPNSYLITFDQWKARARRWPEDYDYYEVDELTRHVA